MNTAARCTASTPRTTRECTSSIPASGCGRPTRDGASTARSTAAARRRTAGHGARVDRVEVARTLRRPRGFGNPRRRPARSARARSPTSRRPAEQKGRRGIVRVRELLEYADGRAESPMESEARLVFIDGGLPTPELQYEIVDRCGDLWRTDFAWPERETRRRVRQHGMAREPGGAQARSDEDGAVAGVRVSDSSPRGGRRAHADQWDLVGRIFTPPASAPDPASPLPASRRKVARALRVSRTFASARGGGGERGRRGAGEEGEEGGGRGFSG